METKSYPRGESKELKTGDYSTTETGKLLLSIKP